MLVILGLWFKQPIFLFLSQNPAADEMWSKNGRSSTPSIKAKMKGLTLSIFY